MSDPMTAQADLPEDRSAARAARALTGATGISLEDLVILDEARASFPNLGTEVSVYKLYDRKTQESVRVALDESGAPLDSDDLAAKERELVAQRYGTMQPALHRLVADSEQSDDDRRVPVLIKYAVTEDVVDKETIDDDELSTRAREAEAAVAEQAADLFRQTLREADLPVPDEVRPSGPFVSAELPVTVVRRLSRDERVAFVGLDREREVPDYPTITESLPTTRAQIVHGNGFRGAGVRIAVLESGTTTVPAACFHIGATQDPGASPNDHMTKSVAIIGNRYSGSWEGYAPDATVLLANAADYKDRYDWARGQGVNVVTMSWHFGTEETDGGLHSRDVYFDYWVTRPPYPSVFTSAGNEADDAYASGKGYNFFGVANVLNDGDGDRSNDAISSTSSWKDPTSPHSDREVPAIAAPGSRHEVIGSSFGGTSAATPVAASIAALLMSRNGSLKIWPEAIRAIMLATANYQDADGADWSKWADGKDGTGLVNAWYGELTAGRRETTDTPQYRAHDYGTMRHADFRDGFYARTYKALTFTTSARIRVALTWNSKTTALFGIPISSVLDADLDLWVYDPDGNLVALSTTWDSSYEFVEFRPQKVGAYTIKIRGFSVPADFESYFGVAWTTHYDV